MDVVVFAISALIILGGAVGVVLASNPVHCALSLVAALFGTAVLFVQQNANFLAAVQVIVYAGAIVVLFLFVIMLLGVDRTEDLDTDPLVGQRPAAEPCFAPSLLVRRTVPSCWQEQPYRLASPSLMSFAKRTGFPIGIITHSTARGVPVRVPKARDWGWLAGKLVAVDYATPA